MILYGIACLHKRVIARRLQLGQLFPAYPHQLVDAHLRLLRRLAVFLCHVLSSVHRRQARPVLSMLFFRCSLFLLYPKSEPPSRETALPTAKCVPTAAPPRQSRACTAGRSGKAPPTRRRIVFRTAASRCEKKRANSPNAARPSDATGYFRTTSSTVTCMVRPFGSGTSSTAPARWPSRAAPMGLSSLIFPTLGSVSDELTIS